MSRPAACTWLEPQRSKASTLLQNAVEALCIAVRCQCAACKGESSVTFARLHTCLTALLKLLALQGADLLHATATGETPLHLAVRGQHLEAVKLLCQTAAACNTADEWGLTPLHVAAKVADVATVRALMLGQVTRSLLQSTPVVDCIHLCVHL